MTLIDWGIALTLLSIASLSQVDWLSWLAILSAVWFLLLRLSVAFWTWVRLALRQYEREEHN